MQAGEVAFDYVEAPGINLSEKRPANVRNLPPIKVSPDYPFVSGIAGIRPSPDWFTGFYLMNTVDEYSRAFLSSFKIRTFPWDAGTANGTTYEDAGQDQDPPDLVQRLTPETAPNGVFVSQRKEIRPVAEWECVLHTCPLEEPDCRKRGWPVPDISCDGLRHAKVCSPCDPAVHDRCQECQDQEDWYPDCCLAGFVPKDGSCEKEEPKEEEPKEEVPKEEVPKEEVPKEEVPKEEVPKEEEPKEEEPEEEVPKEEVPSHLSRCRSDLERADRDEDGVIKLNEYLGFIQHYAKRLCISNPMLTLQQRAAFNKIACNCHSQREAEENCCSGLNAQFEVKASLEYLTAICRLTQETLPGSQCDEEHDDDDDDEGHSPPHAPCDDSSGCPRCEHALRKVVRHRLATISMRLNGHGRA